MPYYKGCKINMRHWSGTNNHYWKHDEIYRKKRVLKVPLISLIVDDSSEKVRVRYVRTQSYTNNLVTYHCCHFWSIKTAVNIIGNYFAISLEVRYLHISLIWRRKSIVIRRFTVDNRVINTIKSTKIKRLSSR